MYHTVLRGGGFFKNKNKNSFRKGEVSKQVVYDGHGRVRTIIIVLVAGERCSITYQAVRGWEFVQLWALIY